MFLFVQMHFSLGHRIGLGQSSSTDDQISNNGAAGSAPGLCLLLWVQVSRHACVYSCLDLSLTVSWNQCHLMPFCKCVPEKFDQHLWNEDRLLTLYLSIQFKKNAQSSRKLQLVRCQLAEAEKSRWLCPKVTKSQNSTLRFYRELCAKFLFFDPE